jgi:NTP pyrophosphatase (non-canonical NTP hydrolase)
MSKPSWWDAVDTIHRHIVRSSNGRMAPAYSEGDYTFLALAMAGEAGEVANEVKKFIRGDYVGDKELFVRKLKSELADVRTYLELLAACIDVDLDVVTIEKIAEVQERWRKKGTP